MEHDATRRAAVLLVGGRTAVRASQALAAARVPHLVVKGLASALTLYEDPIQRAFSDVDVWVPWKAFRRARVALDAEGFSPRVATSHSAVLAAPQALDVDLQAWLGYPFLPAGGFDAIAEDAVDLAVSAATFRAPSSIDSACIAALFAVRDRFRPSSAALVEDVRRGVAAKGEEVVRARARVLGLGRFFDLALRAARAPSRTVRFLDERFPRAMSVMPAALADAPPRAAISFATTAAILAAEHLLRRFQQTGHR